MAGVASARALPLSWGSMATLRRNSNRSFWPVAAGDAFPGPAVAFASFPLTLRSWPGVDAARGRRAAQEALRTAVLVDTVLFVARLKCVPWRKHDIVDLLSSPNRCHEPSCLKLLAGKGAQCVALLPPECSSDVTFFEMSPCSALVPCAPMALKASALGGGLPGTPRRLCGCTAPWAPMTAC